MLLSKHYTLIIDDDGDIRNILSNMMNISGIPSVAVGSGSEAMRQIRAAKPSLVILDLMMPGMDGFTVYEKMRDELDLTEVPVIVSTAYPPDEIGEWRLRGVEAIFAKHELNELIEEVKSVFYDR